MQRSKAGHVISNLFLILLIAGLYLGTTQPQAISASAPVYRGQASDAVALQFAVSWNAAALPEILDTLKAQDTQVTFALSGEWAAANPQLARRMAQEGHELATMGQSPDADGKLSFIIEDLETSLETIQAAAGVRPVLYYSGSRSAIVSGRAAKKLGLTQVLCTVDLLCARGEAADIITRVEESAVIPGGILLLQPTEAAAEALTGVLTALREKGLEPVPIGQVLP